MDIPEDLVLSSPMVPFGGLSSYSDMHTRSSSPDMDSWRSESSANSSGLSLSGRSSYGQQHSSFRFNCENEKLERRLQQIASQNLALHAENEAIRAAYRELVNAVPMLLTLSNPFNLPMPDGPALLAQGPVPSAPLAPPQHEDYPNVHFWLRSAWDLDLKGKKSTRNKAPNPRGGSLASQGINVTAKFIETEDGGIIDCFRLNVICDHARRTWAGLHKRGLAPAEWGEATLTVTREYCEEMARNFPELRLCANHWKAMTLATFN
ncbi:hypothetical protein B0H13DRAFT_1911331 [Mycena leptocephala]|nr:hypothetical protein B0H13DRAFT_1911331 [Mycena leptocephala]